MQFFKTLDKYILKEFLMPLIGSIIIFVMLLQFNFVIFLLKTLNVEAIPIIALVQLVLFKTPDFLRLTTVVGIALASSLAVSRLSRESEFVAMHGAGISFHRIMVSVYWVGIIFTGINFFVMNNLLPQGEASFKKLWNEVLILGIAPEFRSNVVLELPNYAVSIKEVERENDGSIALRKIDLFERPKEDEHWIYRAENGSYSKGIWSLNKPTMIRVIGEQLLIANSYDKLVINEKISVPNIMLLPEPHSLSLDEISKELKIRKLNKKPTRDLEISYHSIFAISLACLVFAIISPIFAIRTAKTGAFTGLMLTLIGVFTYYYLSIISTQILGTATNINPLLVSWIPNIIFLSLGLLAMRRI